MRSNRRLGWFVKLNFLVLGLFLVVMAMQYLSQRGLGPMESVLGVDQKASVVSPGLRKARLIGGPDSQNVDKDSAKP